MSSEPGGKPFRIDTDSSAEHKLPDGRILSYAQYGASDGKPILYFHGLPGSRMEGAYFEEIGKELGARIIGLDRPGYGRSSPIAQKHWKVIDYVRDVDILTDHLKLESYGVLGISGGGPYALACAKALPPERLKCVTVVCGMGAPDMSKRGMRWFNWLGFTFGYPYMPSLSKWYFGRQPQAQLHVPAEERLRQFKADIEKEEGKMDASEFEILTNDSFLRCFIRSAQEAYAQGMDAFAQDGRTMATDWGFKVEDIRKDLPVHLWYGKQDNICPLGFGEQTAQRIGSNAEIHLVDETHASISMKENMKRAYFEAMLKHL